MIKSKDTLKNIVPYSTDKYYDDFLLKLDSNENQYGASPAVINAIRNFPDKKVKLYPAYGALIDKLASFSDTPFENFILTNGCDEAINLILSAFLSKGDELLTFSPTFSMPKLYAGVIGAKFKEIPFDFPFEFDYKKYTDNISARTKILYLTTPNNPTGSVISPDDILNLAKNYQDKLILIDLTYANYSDIDINLYFDLAKKYKNVSIAKSFSKDYALAGLRLGYVFADSALIYELKKIASPYSVNAMALEAGLAALDDLKYFSGVRKKIIKSKEKLYSGLKNSGFTVFNTQANFILCNFGKCSEFILNKLKREKIKIKHFEEDGPLKGFCRITAPRLEDAGVFLKAVSPRPLFVFDLDGVVFDVRNSYRLAIKKTFEHFTNEVCTDFEIQNAKNSGGLSNDWDLTHYLIKEHGYSAKYDELVNIFQSFFFKPDNSDEKGFIDNEEIILDKAFFDELLKYADCAVFTGRPRKEAFYSLEKYGIKSCFSYFVCSEDVGSEGKPSPFGLNLIKNSCNFSDIIYFGDTVDDIKAGVGASVKVFGVIPPGASIIDETKNELIKSGASGVIESSARILNLIKEGELCQL